MDNQVSRFVFKGYTISPEEKQAQFFYEMHHNGEEFVFTDTLLFPLPFSHVSSKSLKPFLETLLLMLGVSYWKLFCPKNIEIVPFTLSKDQAAFWDTVYTKGLGEFFYKNKIKFRGLLHFPYEEKESISQIASSLKQDRSLVPIGGGKDGIVVAELLKKFNKPFTTLLIYTSIEKSEAQESVAEKIGKDVLRIHRQLDSQLFALNTRKDTYNGHVPMVAMHACIELLTAELYDYKYIALGNEESANYGNVEYLGEIMNHQWSKSLEFEDLFQQYVRNYVSNNILFFSLLRSFSEIKIAQIFSQSPQYFPRFVSCNRSFVIHNNGKTFWCGKCPKCAFVFAALVANVNKEEVITIFGKNLFEDESLLPLYKELLGLEAFKPFECVGTPEETTLAFYYAWKREEWNDTPLMQFFIQKVLPTVKNVESLEKKLFTPAENRIPEAFKEVLSV